MLEDIRSISAAMPEFAVDGMGETVPVSRVSRDMERIFGRSAHATARAADPVRSIATERPAAWRQWSMAAMLVGLPALLIAAGAIWIILRAQPAPKVAVIPAVHMPKAPTPIATPTAIPAMINPVAAPAAATPPKPAIRVTGEARCSRLGGSARARCMRPYVLTADRQLRTAYARAVRAGVGSRTLSSYRKRWAQLRGKANANPVTVTAAYRQMARQLDASRRRR